MSDLRRGLHDYAKVTASFEQVDGRLEVEVDELKDEKVLDLQSQLDRIPQTDETLKKEMDELKAERNFLRSRQYSKDMERKLRDIAATEAVVEPNRKIAELEDKV
jgi:FtsZ-binding cell division protein ZapB